MSIILTAGKHAISKQSQQKSKIKKKVHSGAPAQFNPPKSTEKTVVWYWILDGSRTVVMFTIASGEVWCNGDVIQTLESFGTDDSVTDVTFLISTDKGYDHTAIIRKFFTPGGCASHQLFVDGYMILENSGQSPEESVTQITSDGNSTAPPPSYDDLYTSSDQQ